MAVVTNLTENPWYRPVGEIVPGRFTIVWFPHAGGGAAPIVRATRSEPIGANLWVATLPGRESRFNEPLSESMDELIDALVQHFPVRERSTDERFSDAVAPHAGVPDQRASVGSSETDSSADGNEGITLVGHSFGSLLALGVARKLMSGDGASPSLRGLVVMAMSAPAQLVNQNKITHLHDDAFAEQLDRRFGGIPKALRDNKEAMQLFLPTVRHELKLLEAYADDPQIKVAVPITALAGTDDDAASPSRMRDWALQTDGKFEMKMMPGDHFFPLKRLHAIEAIARDMSSAL